MNMITGFIEQTEGEIIVDRLQYAKKTKKSQKRNPDTCQKECLYTQT